MKKVLMICAFAMMSLVFWACGEVPKISCGIDKIEIALNGEYEISQENFVVEEGYTLGFALEQNNVVKMENNVLYPLKEGESFLKVYIQEKPEVFLLVGVQVNEEYLTENASPIKTNISINIAENNTNFNKIIIDERSQEIPQISYDSSVIDYDYATGEIVAKSTGTTKVQIKFTKCSTAFDVSVTSQIYASFMQVEDKEVLPKSSGKFDFIIFPNNANTYVFYSNDASIRVERNGEYEILGKNNAIVHYYYYKADGIRSDTKSFRVSVVKPIEDFDIYVTTLEGDRVQVIEKDINYRLCITIKDVDTTQVSFSTNVNVQSVVLHEEEISFVVFNMSNLGECEISVTYCTSIAGQVITIHKTLSGVIVI